MNASGILFRQTDEPGDNLEPRLLPEVVLVLGSQSLDLSMSSGLGEDLKGLTYRRRSRLHKMLSISSKAASDSTSGERSERVSCDATGRDARGKRTGRRRREARDVAYDFSASAGCPISLLFISLPRLRSLGQVLGRLERGGRRPRRALRVALRSLRRQEEEDEEE